MDLTSFYDWIPKGEIVMPNAKSIGAKCGHVKRQLKEKKPLTGDLLEFALGAVGADNYVLDGEGKYVSRDGRPLTLNDEPYISIASKLRTGQPLGDYELHLMIDVFLLHTRLA